MDRWDLFGRNDLADVYEEGGLEERGKLVVRAEYTNLENCLCVLYVCACACVGIMIISVMMVYIFGT